MSRREPPHGSWSRYSNQRCRCKECVVAAAAYRSAKRPEWHEGEAGDAVCAVCGDPFVRNQRGRPRRYCEECRLLPHPASCVPACDPSPGLPEEDWADIGMTVTWHRTATYDYAMGYDMDTGRGHLWAWPHPEVRGGWLVRFTSPNTTTVRVPNEVAALDHCRTLFEMAGVLGEVEDHG